MKLIDIHAHVNFPEFAADRPAVIARALAAGIGMINVGTDLATSRAAVALAHQYEGDPLWASVGLHPTDVTENFDYQSFKVLAGDPRVVAIGECGLDYFHIKDKALQEKQKEIFKQQLELAREVKKPLMIHCRPALGTEDAYLDLLEILNYNLKANIHFFAGSWLVAEQFIARGCTLSFTGVITFTHDYDEVIRQAPLESIMIETDCPFVAPNPYRGKRNEPVYLLEVAKRLAQIKDVSEESLAHTLMANARRVFNSLLWSPVMEIMEDSPSNYEVAFLLSPLVAVEALEASLDKIFREPILAAAGEIAGLYPLRMVELAYPLKPRPSAGSKRETFHSAHFGAIRFTLSPTALTTLEMAWRNQGEVLRFLLLARSSFLPILPSTEASLPSEPVASSPAPTLVMDQEAIDKEIDELLVPVV